MSKWFTWLKKGDHGLAFENGQQVLADGGRCIQCGICGYNCPVGIPVRDYARQGLAVDDASCIKCGNCVAVCPRGTLSVGDPLTVNGSKK